MLITAKPPRPVLCVSSLALDIFAKKLLSFQKILVYLYRILQRMYRILQRMQTYLLKFRLETPPRKKENEQ